MSARDNLAEAIQSTAQGDDDLHGAVCTGWVVVAEFMDPNGQRWLSRMAGDVQGKVPPTWTLKGWLTDSLDDMSNVVYITEDPDEDDD